MSALAISLHGMRRWVKHSDQPLARLIYRYGKRLRSFQVPLIRPLHGALYLVHRSMQRLLSGFMRMAYWTPLFQSRLQQFAPRLFLFGGMPTILGNVDIHIGEDCRVSGHTTISGRSSSACTPALEVGRNCDIGWLTTIACGSRVVLGDNVRIAGRAFLAGYPGHPLDPIARARGLPDLDEQVGDIVLEDDVWLATGVSVMAGVRIGAGTVVAAGSVVTQDLPPGVIAGGVPARVIRAIDC
jgi:acetyltransferase-like isoleucine patch superfamily enzyme